MEHDISGRLERVFVLCRFFGHICESQRNGENIGAGDLEVGEAVEGIGLDGMRIGAVCTERIQNRLYQSSGEEDAVLWKLESWNSVGPCFKGKNLVE